MTFWKTYWENKKNGGHRWQEENFLKKEAAEKLYHLSGGNSLLDFGCGSADLLVYYAPEYSIVVGVDFSSNMLNNARVRLMNFGCDNVQLVQADDINVWERVSESFDRITAGQVVQYLKLEHLDRFINVASQRLNSGGKIILFDIIDPRIYFLVRIGVLIPKNTFTKNAGIAIAKSTIRLAISKPLAILKQKPADMIGNSHHPGDIYKIARKYDLEMEYVCSMYYEYRYHVILTRK
jgi:cyclopropane fatty-acyl-phospholipid synthase-like methyltransferase